MGRYHEWSEGFDEIELLRMEWEPDGPYQLRHSEQDKWQVRGLYDDVHRSQMERNWHPDPYDCI